jgi:hypothetical protein
VGHRYPAGIAKALDLLPDEETKWVCDLCALRLTGRFFAGQPTTVCLLGHDLPEEARLHAVCPICRHEAGIPEPICLICRKPGPDYTTHIHLRGHGYLRATVHMDCLIEEGGTHWSPALGPHLEPDVMAEILPIFATDRKELERICTADRQIFNAKFPALAREIKELEKRLGRSMTQLSIVEEITRPVDRLIGLRSLYEQVAGTPSHTLYVQERLL